MDQIDLFIHHFPLVKYPKGTHFFADHVYPYFLYLKKGAVQLNHTAYDGEILHLHIFYPGACISLLSLVEPREPYDFIALTEAEAYKIPREAFLQSLHRNPELSFHFLMHAMKGMKGLLYRVHHDASASAYQRVASLLLYFLKHSKSHITHQEIAEWLGLSRENVSIQMKRLEREGLIGKEKNKIILLQTDRLQKIADL